MLSDTAKKEPEGVKKIWLKPGHRERKKKKRSFQRWCEKRNKLVEIVDGPKEIAKDSDRKEENL